MKWKVCLFADMSEVRYRRLPQHEEDGNGTSIY